MIETIALDREFGKPTKEEWDIYYKVRRHRTSWDVSAYLHWDWETHYMTLSEIKQMEDDHDWIPVTKGEFLFMCEYVEENFNTETTIWDLMEDAYEIVCKAREQDYRCLGEEVMKIISRTILLERFFPASLKA